MKQRPAATGRSSRWDRSLGITVVAGLTLLLVLGLVFSVVYGSQRITSSAAALHDADETLRVATVARAQLALAVHAAETDRVFGTNSSEAVNVSISEADEALDNLVTGVEHLVAEVGGGVDGLTGLATRFVEHGETIIGLLEATDSEAAQMVAETSLAGEFDALVSGLVDARNELSATVSESDRLLGRVGNMARFLVAFLIPAAVILIYRELVRRQQAQAELETRLESERHLNAARERFIANASHELRTPLTSILGLSMMLAESDLVQEEPVANELVDLIITESEDLARMVEDLLTVARLDAGALHYAYEDVGVAEEVDQIVETLVRAGVDLGADCDDALLRVDRLRFRQVLRNLLSNARKYGGSKIRIEGRVEGRTYLCSVIDDGDGIPEDVVPRLFERFIHQGHATASKDSVGLGLSIVHALAQGMGGSVSYARIDDETHFACRVPLAADVAPDEESPWAFQAPASESTATRPLVGSGIEHTTPYPEEDGGP